MRKSVFITGGTSGIGLGLADRYLNSGFTVGVCSFEKTDVAMKVLSPGIHYFEADVTDTARMNAVIHEFSAKAGSLDLVIANAGINHPKVSSPDFVHGTKVINVNVNGVLNTFGPAIEVMKKQGKGHLVGVSSVAGVIGSLPRMAIYCASKAAVLSLCESLAIDLKAQGIEVTTLAPGFIDTPLTRSNTHAMPFQMSADDAVSRIYRAIENKKGLFLFPLPLKIAALMIRFVPKNLYRRLMQFLVRG